MAHIGVIQALCEQGVEVHRFAGTSAGALVGVMAAAGCSVEDMLSFWMDHNPFRLKHLAFSLTGLIDTAGYADILRHYVSADRFEDLPRPITVALTSMLAGEARYVSEGPLWPLIMGTAAYPMVFEPVAHEGELYLDGGIVDNLPASAIRPHCDVLIGVNVSPKRAMVAEELDDPLAVMQRLLEIKIGVSTERAAAVCDLMIVPQYIKGYGAFDTSAWNMLEVYRAGLEAGRAAMGRVKALIQQAATPT